MKRQRKFLSSFSSDELLVPKAQAQQRQLTALTKLAVPAVPVKGKFRAIAPSAKRTSTPLQTARPQSPVVDLTRSSSSSGGVINTPVATSSPVDKPSSLKTDPISIKIDNKRSDKTRRITIQPGAELVSDAAGLMPVSSEDD